MTKIFFDLDYKLIDCDVHVLPQKFHANDYGKVCIKYSAGLCLSCATCIYCISLTYAKAKV